MGDDVSVEQLQNNVVSDEAASEINKRDFRFKNVQAPLDGYQLSESEINQGNNVTNFYGFENKDGKWSITQQVRDGVLTTYTFITGDEDFATNWANRALLPYATFSNAF